MYVFHRCTSLMMYHPVIDNGKTECQYPFLCFTYDVSLLCIRGLWGVYDMDVEGTLTYNISLFPSY